DKRFFQYNIRDPHAPPRVGQVGIYLVRDSDGKRKLALRPDGLAEALYLYAARMATTGTTFNACEHCKTPFLSGGSSESKKRGDSRFCSDTCRWRHHNEKQRNARIARKKKL